MVLRFTIYCRPSTNVKHLHKMCKNHELMHCMLRKWSQCPSRRGLYLQLDAIVCEDVEQTLVTSDLNYLEFQYYCTVNDE